MKTSLFVLTVFAPLSHRQVIEDALTNAGAGALGNYKGCHFTTIGDGSFIPTENASPHIGTTDKRETVTECRIETVVAEDNLPAVVLAIKAVHPYEEPAIHITALLDYKTYL